MASSRHNRPMSGLDKLGMFSLLTAVLWCALMITRVGPILSTQDVTSPAKQGSTLIRNLASRYVHQPAIDGRVHLMPFQPMLWGGGISPEMTRVTRMEVEASVPGLTHLDLMLDHGWPDSVIFRLSRHPNVPSGLVRRQWEHQIGLHTVDSSEWVVSEDILTPDRRGQLVQAEYHLPQGMFHRIEDEFQGEWFTIVAEREGDLYRITVNDEVVVEETLEGMPHGRWGVAGGDLPFVQVRQWSIEAVQPIHGEWRHPVSWECDFNSPLLIAGHWTVQALLLWFPIFAACLIGSLLCWVVVPRRGWGGWMRLSIAWQVPALLVLAWDLQRGNPPLLHHLTLRLWLCIALGVGVMIGQLIAARRDWRWQPGERALWSGLNLWQRRWALGGLVTAVVLLGIVAIQSRLTAGMDQTLRLSVPLEWQRERPMQRGDFTSTLDRSRAGEVSTDLDSTLRLEILQAPATIEILTRLGNHTINAIREWHAVRLSTESGESGHFTTRNSDPPESIAWTLPEEGVVTLNIRTDETTVTISSGEEVIVEFPEHELGRGGLGLLVREGVVDPQILDVHMEVGSETPVPGGAHGQERWAPGWLVGPPLIFIALLPLFALLLALWWRCDVGHTLRCLLGIWMVATPPWIWITLRWLASPPQWGIDLPLLPIGLTLVVVSLGFVSVVAAGGEALRRRWPTLLLMFAVIFGGAEMAMRGTFLRDALRVEYQGGRYTDQFLMRPVIAPMVFLAATGQFQGRIYRPLPDRTEGTTTRIFCMGGSSTYGSGVIRDDFTWPYLVEEALFNDHDLDVEIFNHGYPDFTTFDVLCFLRAGLVDLDPDWVILSVTGNDAIASVGNPPTQRTQFEAIDDVTAFQHLLRHSRLVVALSRWLSGAFGDPESHHTVPRVTPEEMRENLEEIIALGEERGFGVILIAEPMWERMAFNDSRHQPWADVVYAVAEEHGLPLIDPTTGFRHQIPADCWATWIHPTWRGNQVMRDAVTPVLAEALTTDN